MISRRFPRFNKVVWDLNSNSNFNLAPSRLISSTPTSSGWFDSIKQVFTGKKPSTGAEELISWKDFTLFKFADELGKARKIGNFKDYIVGRSGNVSFRSAFEKNEAIIRHLGSFDPTGEHLSLSHKQSTAKHCNCTITDVENALAKFTWAKEAQKKLEKWKEEGKSIPTNMAELTKMMGSTPQDLARSNLAKSGQVSRNAVCPCGSKKRYKRCCGKEAVP